jgi:hypothetical protein
MKNTLLILLIAILAITLVNMAVGLGVIGGGSGGSGDYTYRVVNAQEMDSVGFTAVAKEVGVEPDEEGKMDLPGEQLLKPALLPRTIQEIEKDGWEFVSVTSDNHYIFRK